MGFVLPVKGKRRCLVKATFQTGRGIVFARLAERPRQSLQGIDIFHFSKKVLPKRNNVSVVEFLS